MNIETHGLKDGVEGPTWERGKSRTSLNLQFEDQSYTIMGVIDYWTCYKVILNKNVETFQSGDSRGMVVCVVLSFRIHD